MGTLLPREQGGRGATHACVQGGRYGLRHRAVLFLPDKVASVSDEGGERGGGYCWVIDLVAWELVDASAITVVKTSMFAIGWGFAVPAKREGLAMEMARWKDLSWLEKTCPLITLNARAKARKP